MSVKPKGPVQTIVFTGLSYAPLTPVRALFQEQVAPQRLQVYRLRHDEVEALVEGKKEWSRETPITDHQLLRAMRAFRARERAIDSDRRALPPPA